MSYTVNQHGRIFYGEIEVPMELGNPLYESYIEFLNNGGTVEKNNILVKEDIDLIVSEYRKLYSEKISNIPGMKEALERFLFDGTPIPSEISDQRSQLKSEYHSVINQLIGL